VSGLGLAGDCGSRLEPKFFFYHVLAAGMATQVPSLPAASPDAARSEDFV